MYSYSCSPAIFLVIFANFLLIATAQDLFLFYPVKQESFKSPPHPKKRTEKGPRLFKPFGHLSHMFLDFKGGEGGFP